MRETLGFPFQSERTEILAQVLQWYHIPVNGTLSVIRCILTTACPNPAYKQEAGHDQHYIFPMLSP